MINLCLMEQSQSMKLEKDRSHMTERILQLALEIIYLLTGEVFGPVKKAGNCITHNSHHMLEKWGRCQNLIMESSPAFLTPERNSDRRILEVTKKIIELLTGEVPIRCQDVAVHFSMEEWHYLEGHKELYKDVIMEDQSPLQSLDGPSNRNPPERWTGPKYSQDYAQEPHKITQEDQMIPYDNQICIKAEDTAGEEETFLETKMKAEEDKVHTDGSVNRNPPETCPPYTQMSVQEYKSIPQGGQGGNPSWIKAKCMDEVETYVRCEEPCEEEEIPSEINPGYFYLPVDRSVFCDFKTKMVALLHTSAPEISSGHHEENTEERPKISPDDDLSTPIPEENVITPCLHPVHPSRNRSSDLPSHGGDFTYLSSPVSHSTSDKLFQCTECGRSFTKRARLIVHQRSHTGEKPFLCSECGRCFAQTSHLFRHSKVHTTKKPFLCSECGRCFKEKAHLLRHQKIHIGEKPYTCPICGKRFREKANLIQHDIYHSGNYPYCCSECGKCFLSKSRLDVHLMTHSGEKPYSCSDCGKCFLHKSVFVRHQKIHLGLKPFSCPQCGKCFMYKSQMVRHEQNHAGVKPYICSDCGKCFLRRPDLISHQLAHR